MSIHQISSIVVIACAVFQHLLEELIPHELTNQITFLDYGLHLVSLKLKKSIQDAIDSIEEPSLIILGYGLCGNGLDGIRANKHTILVPRADDCIAILLGSYKQYKEEFSKNPGTYYLTKGWLESGSDPLKEYQDLLKRYDRITAEWIMDQQYRNYRRIALIAHTVEDLEKYRARSLEVAKYCEQWGMQYEEILGSDSYLKMLVKTTESLNEPQEEIIVIPPGGEIDQKQFLR